jgi:tRNA threonylcarbamoyladenosine biosynthesis protein TsaB
MSAAAPRLVVALETSSARPGLAARRGERCAETTLPGDRPHASDLLPTLEALLGRLDAGPAEIGAVVVGTGPGSYTGLRVGVATALGLARGAGAALYGVPSPEALAFGELAPGQSAAVLLDARQGELYLARYRREQAEVRPLLAPCVTTAAGLADLLPAGELVYADEAALRAAGLEGERARCPGRFTQAWPRAGALLELGSARLQRDGSQSPAQVEPLYLRAFAARTRRR